MTVQELNIGDVFRVVGDTKLWRKSTPTEARELGPNATTLRAPGLAFNPPKTARLSTFNNTVIEVIERASEICRAENTLVLRGGEVTLWVKSGNFAKLR